MKVGSLFSGIGGLDLGLERAGMEIVWQVENDEYCKRVLAKHWPDTRRWDDVRTFPPEGDWSCDLICGGFPCQDISYAGRGAGIEGERSGLFFEALRVVRQLRPEYVLLENVAALLSRGLDRVCGELAQIGYDAEWHCIPAAAVGAPHIRDRVFILGYSAGSRASTNAPSSSSRNTVGKPGSHLADVADTTNNGIGWGQQQSQGSQEKRDVADPQGGRTAAAQQPGQVCGLEQGCPDVSDTIGEHDDHGRHGASSLLWQRPESPDIPGGEQWVTEPGVGRVADGVPSRVDRLRGLGNAVVPQVAEWLGRQLLECRDISQAP